MFDKNTCLPDNTVTNRESTVERARDYRRGEYDKKRLGRQWQMKRQDRFERTFAQRLFEMVGSDSHIVDIPCGNGRFFEIFSHTKELTMADYSINMLRVCEETFGPPANVRLLRAEISSIPLLDNSADLCFCIRLFHHMKTDLVRLGALKELARISRKYVALSFYNKNCLKFYWRKMLGKKIRGNYVTFDHFIGLAKQAGLELVERFPKVSLVGRQCLVVFRKTQDG